LPEAEEHKANVARLHAVFDLSSFPKFRLIEARCRVRLAAKSAAANIAVDGFAPGGKRKPIRALPSELRAESMAPLAFEIGEREADSSGARAGRPVVLEMRASAWRVAAGLRGRDMTWRRDRETAEPAKCRPARVEGRGSFEDTMARALRHRQGGDAEGIESATKKPIDLRRLAKDETCHSS